MSRVGRGLALHAAVPIEMATAASLGWDTGLVRTIGVGAGLGRPVAGAALEPTGSIRKSKGHEAVKRLVIKAFDTSNKIAPLTHT